MFCEPTDFIPSGFVSLVRNTVMQHSSFSIEWQFLLCMLTVPSCHPLLCLDCVVRGQRPSGCEVFHGWPPVIEWHWLEWLAHITERNTKEQVSKAVPPLTFVIWIIYCSKVLLSFSMKVHSMLIHVRCLFLCILESSLPQKYHSACFSVALLSFQLPAPLLRSFYFLRSRWRSFLHCPDTGAVRRSGPLFCSIRLMHCTTFIFWTEQERKM